MIDLQPFCADPEWNRAIAAPWSRDGYTWTTNGIILIRVPLRPEVGDNERCPQIVGNSVGANLDKEPAAWFDMPDFPAPADGECEECEGSGWVTPRTRWNEYDEQECKTCGGDGRVGQDRPVDIGEACFTDRLLEKLRHLPNVKIGPFGPDEAARITFDGGDGLLMPRRK